MVFHRGIDCQYDLAYDVKFYSLSYFRVMIFLRQTEARFKNDYIRTCRGPILKLFQIKLVFLFSQLYCLIYEFLLPILLKGDDFFTGN